MILVKVGRRRRRLATKQKAERSRDERGDKRQASVVVDSGCAVVWCGDKERVCVCEEGSEESRKQAVRKQEALQKAS